MNSIPILGQPTETLPNTTLYRSILPPGGSPFKISDVTLHPPQGFPLKLSDLPLPVELTYHHDIAVEDIQEILIDSFVFMNQENMANFFPR